MKTSKMNRKEGSESFEGYETAYCISENTEVKEKMVSTR